MKHNFKYFACLLVAVLCFGQVWGADPDVTYDFTGSGWTVSNGTLTNGTVSFTGEGGANFKMNSGYFMMGKSGAYITFPAYPKAVEKIVVTGKSGASGSVGQNIFVGDNAASTATTGATGVNTYNIAANYQTAGNIYILKVTTAHNTQITKIEVFYVSGSDEPGGGDEPGSGDDPEPTGGDTYELVTNVSDLAVDDEIIIVNVANSKALSTTQNSNNRGAVAVTITNDAIVPGDDVQIITLGQTNEHWTLYTGSGYLYASSSSSNQLRTQATNNTNGEWTISISNKEATLTAQGSNTRNVMQYNSGSTIFACYGTASQAALAIFKKSDGTPQKPAAGLAYAEADLKKLVKLGDAFTAPTLVNPHGVAVTYASSAESVATVAANGAVTINAAGVATITASYDGSGDYKEGSASYTICVVSHAGTEADPYDVADARNVIDALGTKEGVYMSGTVSQITTAYDETYHNISFDISADGTTAVDQVRAFRCKGLDNTDFTSEDDVKTGATVTVYGNLTKYNSTYEFEAGCYLKAYEAPTVPKTSIANTKETAYTVAQAITYAADGVTYDLDDYVYVQGVVYDVKSFSEGVMNIFIKDANAENQFELFKCAGINDGNATTPFEALTDVQAGNIVIGYGQLTVFNTTYEFKQGNYLVDLQKPVTGVELDATAEVEAGSTVNLTATILPSNATGTIVWTVESGDTYASVNENGVVTGIAEGEALIRATVQGTEIYAECTVTVNAGTPVLTNYYEKVTETAGITDGTYLIVYEADGLAFNGGLTTLDAESNTIAVAITNDNKIGVTEATAAATFFIDVTAGSIQAANGKYIGVSSYGNGLKTSETSDYTNAFAIDGDGNAVISIYNATWNKGSEGTMILRYNSASGQTRFRYYKEGGQQAIQLYKLANETVKEDPQLTWSAESVTITVGDEFISPTLSHKEGFTGTITFASDNESLATVSNAGVISLEAEATGIAHITASFAGDDTYKAVNVACTITVNATTPAPVGTENVVIIAEYNSKFYALTNSISNKTAAAVVIEKDGDNIIVPSADAKTAIQWTKTTSGENTTFQDADGKYLKGVSNGGDLTVVDDACNWNWNSTDQYYYIGSRSFIYRESANGFKNYATSNAGASDYSAIAEVRVIAAENIVVTSKADPQLAYSPTSVELTVGGTFTPATLTYASGFDGLAAVTYESSNTNLATVEGGVVSLVADATGTATITASFAGNNNYLSGSASYTIKVNEVQKDLPDAWVLVTNINQIESGMSVIIASEIVDGNIYTMGAQNSNNRAGVQSFIENGVLTPYEGTEIFKLTNVGNNCFAIQASNNNCLYAASSSSNQLKEEATPDSNDNYKWSISIENDTALILAQGKATRNLMRFNPNNGNPIFSCYENKTDPTGNAVALYIPKVEEDPDPQPDELVYTEVRTDLVNGYHYTLCLKKKIVAVDGGTFWTVGRRDAAHTVAYLEEVRLPLKAGVPVIFQATASTLKVAYEGDEVDDPVEQEGNALRGTFSELNAAALEAACTNMYMLYNNQICQVRHNNGNFLSAFRAYIDDNAMTTGDAPQTPGRRVRSIPMQGNVATGIDNIGISDQPMKVFIDGQLYILRGEKLYDSTGRMVK